MFIRKIYNNGKSLIITIPAPIANQLQLDHGDYLKIQLTKTNQITITPINLTSQKTYKLAKKGANK